MKFKPINNLDPRRWKEDTRRSVLFYNDWFIKFAPSAYVGARLATIDHVADIFMKTSYLRTVTADLLKKNPEMLSILRMATTPPLARDRLAGLADVPSTFLKTLEGGRVSARHSSSLGRVVDVINALLDKDLMPWLDGGKAPGRTDLLVAKAIIGDRACGAAADPIIKNAQERRQLLTIEKFLEGRSYRLVKSRDITSVQSMPPGTYAYHQNLPAKVGSGSRKANISVDVVVQRKDAKKGDFPLLVECKSAGDFVNPNKRRKEEAAKMGQLTATYGKKIRYILFLCGYFDTAYLGYEAAEGIDWVWEHRVADLEKAGV